MNENICLHSEVQYSMKSMKKKNNLKMTIYLVQCLIQTTKTSSEEDSAKTKTKKKDSKVKGVLQGASNCRNGMVNNEV